MRLKELRDHRGVSQDQIGEYIGCSGAAYSRYETGDREPSIEVMKKLADYFGVSLDYLLENKEFEETTISEQERKFLKAYRKADLRSREDAMLLLDSHSVKSE